MKFTAREFDFGDDEFNDIKKYFDGGGRGVKKQEYNNSVMHEIKWNYVKGKELLRDKKYKTAKNKFQKAVDLFDANQGVESAKHLIESAKALIERIIKEDPGAWQ